MDLPPFQNLLDAHGVDLHRFCVAQVGADAGADCFQEAIIAALRAYPSLTSTANLRGWLFTIAHRKMIDHHRAVARRPVPVGAVPEREVAELTPDGDLWAAVAALPDKQRGAVTMRYLADLPYSEIAGALDCTEAAARQSVRAALANLRVGVSR